MSLAAGRWRLKRDWTCGHWRGRRRWDETEKRNVAAVCDDLGGAAGGGLKGG